MTVMACSVEAAGPAGQHRVAPPPHARLGILTSIACTCGEAGGPAPRCHRIEAFSGYGSENRMVAVTYLGLTMLTFVFKMSQSVLLTS
jgi:hypothetical protein